MSDDPAASAPFEGPEKLLEIWFAPSAADVPDALSTSDRRTGLRKVDPQVWEEMLDIVRCKVLSSVRGQDIDAYLLSESSLFISPHRLILKTCGTTLNLLGLPRILQIASVQANMHSVYRCFYSRKSFMFPDRQEGPHRDWKYEVEFLDNIFENGAAYTVGKVNGDHWLLYMTNPVEGENLSPASVLQSPDSIDVPDFTIEILMSDLSSSARLPFSTAAPDGVPSGVYAQTQSSDVGITNIFPSALTTLDAYTFSPCGYSCNALIRWDEHPVLSTNPGTSSPGEGYYTIHVTPEEGWSYASFECNVPLPAHTSTSSSSDAMPDLQTLIQRVVSVFQPGHLSVTLFVSNNGDDHTVELAQKAFKAALTARSTDNGNAPFRLYKRTDKINYEFEGYDLAFASFEVVGR